MAINIIRYVMQRSNYCSIVAMFIVSVLCEAEAFVISRKACPKFKYIFYLLVIRAFMKGRSNYY